MTSVLSEKRGRGRPADPERVAQRRGEILGVAARCFGARGYNETDVRWIASELGITKGTIYHYFDSKENLFLCVVDAEISRLKETVLRAANGHGDPLEEVSAVVHAYLQFFEDHPHVVELLIEERATFRDRKKHTYFVHRDMTLDRWHRLTQRLIDQKRARPIDPRKPVAVLSDLLYGTIFTNYFAGTNLSAHEQAENILDIYFNGILVQPSAGNNIE